MKKRTCFVVTLMILFSQLLGKGNVPSLPRYSEEEYKRLLYADYGIMIREKRGMKFSVAKKYINWVIDYNEGFYSCNFYNGLISNRDSSCLFILQMGLKTSRCASLRKEIFKVTDGSLIYPEQPNDGIVYLMGPGRIPDSFRHRPYLAVVDGQTSADTVYFYKVPSKKKVFFDEYETSDSYLNEIIQTKVSNVYRYIFKRKGFPEFNVIMAVADDDKKEKYEEILLKTVLYK